MKSKRNLWVLFFVVIIAGVFGLYRMGVFEQKDPIYIAVSAPGEDVSAPWTTEVTRSVQMYIDEANAEGGINGHEIKMITYIDGGDPAQAESVAEKIVQENKAMIVLGNGYSDPATAMGKVLAANNIPGMTSGATAPSVTEGNEWFFRVINDNTAQGSFVAQYASIFFGHKSAIILYEDNSYGSSLAVAFDDEFSAHGGTVFSNSPISSKSETLEKDIADIINSSEEKPDMFFLATYKRSGAVAAIYLQEHYPGIPVFGGDSLGADSFAAVVAEELGKAKADGITDGIYAPAQLIFDVASERAQIFRDRYIKNVGEMPTWFAATSYDSALVTIKAMRAAGISGDPSQIAQDRLLLRDYLASIDQRSEDFEGVSGQIYFDEDHNYTQPLAMGLFSNDKFISAPVQLYHISVNDLPDDYLEKLRSGEILRINRQYFGRTRIIYVGIDINEFSELDIEGDHTYLADFYLWFRYEGEKIDFEDISFDNSVAPIDLGSPIEDKEIGNGHYTLFRIRQNFRNTFNLEDYPFDHHSLAIKLRHDTLERKDLIFVTDTLGIGEITREKTLDNLDKAHAFETISDWFPVTGLFFADSIHDFSTRGNPAHFDKKNDIEHSRFNVEIEIKRDYLRFLSKTMLPILAILVLSYLALFLPDREFETITSIMTGTVLSVIFFHVGLSGRLNVGYSVAIDYVFYAIYALLAVETFLSIVAWRKISKNNVDMSVKYMFWFMRALYPIVFTAVIVFTIINYDLI